MKWNVVCVSQLVIVCNNLLQTKQSSCRTLAKLGKKGTTKIDTSVFVVVFFSVQVDVFERSLYSYNFKHDHFRTKINSALIVVFQIELPENIAEMHSVAFKCAIITRSSTLTE